MCIVSHILTKLLEAGEVIIRRKLLRRRHIAKLRKEQTLCRTTRVVSTSDSDAWAFTEKGHHRAVTSFKHYLPYISPVHRVGKRAKLSVQHEFGGQQPPVTVTVGA